MLVDAYKNDVDAADENAVLGKRSADSTADIIISRILASNYNNEIGAADEDAVLGNSE